MNAYTTRFSSKTEYAGACAQLQVVVHHLRCDLPRKVRNDVFEVFWQHFVAHFSLNAILAFKFGGFLQHLNGFYPLFTRLRDRFYRFFPC